MIEIEKISKEKNELAKVLWYYNLISDVNSETCKIVCEFHDDINPSMIVNLIENSFFCFGCGANGDAFKFVKLMEERNGLNDLQALKKYIQILKSEKCSELVIKKFIIKDKPKKKELYNQAYDYYHGLSKINWMKSKEDEVMLVKDYMIPRGFTKKSLRDSKAKVTYNHSYGLIFPMLDNGKFKGWVCRTTIKAIEKKRKYLYNEGFSRASTLVGDYGSKDYVIVVEGFMDRLKFVQFGESNVVAILGWKMSNGQIQKLKDKGVEKIISALDNDECGRKGTRYLATHFEVTNFRYLKGLKDPGGMNEKQFNRMLKQTMNDYKSNIN